MTIQAFSLDHTTNGGVSIQESDPVTIQDGEGLRIRFTDPGIIGRAEASLRITANGVTSLAPIRDRDNFVLSPGEVLAGDVVRIVAQLGIEAYSSVTGVMETF